MVVDTMDEPDPWMLEDLQLRCELAAERMQGALDLGHAICEKVPEPVRGDFGCGLRELHEVLRRTRAYVYHTRETNLCTVLRTLRAQGVQAPAGLVEELRDVLVLDQHNQGYDEPIAGALEVLGASVDRFLDTYFLPGPDEKSKGYCSLTSR